MQAIYENKNVKYNNKKADLVDVIIYSERISKYLEGEFFERSRDINIGIYNNKEKFW